MAFLRRSRDSQKGSLNSMHLVYQQESNPNKPQTSANLVLFTDGASKLSACDRKYFSFSGWGCVITCPESNAFKDKIIYGAVSSKDSESAELAAVLEGVRAITVPATVLVVTDCAYVINGMKRLISLLGSRRSMDGPILAVDTASASRNDLWEELFHVIQSNVNVTSIHCQWVPAHTVDDIDMPDQYRSLDQFFKHGNKRADAAANLGAAVAVEHAWRKVVSMPKKERQAKSLALSMAIENSGFVQRATIEFIKNNSNHVPPDMIRGMPQPVVSAYRRYRLMPSRKSVVTAQQKTCSVQNVA